MKKRKAETLVEVIIAFAAFGVLLGGVTDFMATHLKFIAWTKQRDELIYTAQVLMTSKDVWSNLIDGDDHKEASYDWDIDNKKLTLKNNSYSMDFTLP